MFVSFPILMCHRAVAQAIAASGVSELDDEQDPEPTTIHGTSVRTMAWRVHEHPGNPYLRPTPTCPECGTMVVRASGCIGCPACGWGKCG